MSRPDVGEPCVFDGHPVHVSRREGFGIWFRNAAGVETERYDIDDLRQWRRLSYLVEPGQESGVTQLRPINGVAPPLEGEVQYDFNAEITMPHDVLSTLTIGTVITVGNASFQLFRVTYEDGVYLYHVNDSEGHHRTFGANIMRALLATSDEAEARRITVSQPLSPPSAQPLDLQGWCEP